MAKIISESDEELEVKFNINKNYADRYDNWRRKEELQKFKDRFGKDALDKSEDDSSSSSSEDDGDDLEMPQEFNKEFYRTLSCLKSKDPKIYDKNTKFFDNVNVGKGAGSKSENKSKPLFLRDYERKVIQEGGLLSDEDEVVDGDFEEKVVSPSYFEEQDAIKESFKDHLHPAEDDGKEDPGIGGLFSKKVKSREELEKEEDDYTAWLLGNRQELEDVEEENKLSHLRSYWADPKLNPGEAFLRDYILQKRFKPVVKKVKKYFSKEEEEEEDESDPDDGVSDGDLLEQEEKEIERMEEFEHKFNFRFEEPDQEFIKRYPRTLDHSLRKKDDKRKQKRDDLRTRKEAEKQKLKEQLSKAKELKQKEIEERLKQLCNITGNADLGFEGKDLDDDFDPEEHDKKMKEIFSEEAFYGIEDNVKPVFPSMDEELDMEDWDTWGVDESYGERTANQVYSHSPGNAAKSMDSEDPNFNMDCDYDPKKSFQEEMLAACGKKSKGERGKGRRWRARQSRLAKGLLKDKPQFDPMEVLSKAKLCQGDAATAFEKYVDEYYGLEYEDIIGGDLPCRFKYRKVIPNDFGLSVEEILSADDKELNRWCSLKKAVQIRPEENEKYDLQAYRKKSSNLNLKKKVFRSLYASPEEPQADKEESQGKRSKKDKNKYEEKDNSPISRSNASVDAEEKADSVDVEDMETEILKEANSVDSAQKKKKKRKRSKKGKVLEHPHEKPGRNVEKSASAMEGINDNRTEESDGKRCSNVKEIEMEEEGGEKVKKKAKDVASPKKRKKEKGVKSGKIKKQHGPENYLSGLSKSRLKAYGINPKRFGNKLKYKPSVSV